MSADFRSFNRFLTFVSETPCFERKQVIQIVQNSYVGLMFTRSKMTPTILTESLLWMCGLNLLKSETQSKFFFSDPSAIQFLRIVKNSWQHLSV